MDCGISPVEIAARGWVSFHGELDTSPRPSSKPPYYHQIDHAAAAWGTNRVGIRQIQAEITG